MEVETIVDDNFPFEVNFFYLPEFYTLIDTGTGKMDFDFITKLDAIILTHGHPDHINGVHVLRKKFPNVKVFMNESDNFMVNFEYEKLSNEIEINGLKFKIIPTPGHSPGGVCLYFEKEKTLFSGDTVFSNGVVGRWDFPGGNFQKLFNSIKKLEKLDIEKIYPGHGKPVLENGNEHIKLALEKMEEYRKNSG